MASSGPFQTLCSNEMLVTHARAPHCTASWQLAVSTEPPLTYVHHFGCPTSSDHLRPPHHHPRWPDTHEVWLFAQGQPAVASRSRSWLSSGLWVGSAAAGVDLGHGGGGRAGSPTGNRVSHQLGCSAHRLFTQAAGGGHKGAVMGPVANSKWQLL